MGIASDWKTKSPNVEENPHDQAVLVEEKPADMQQQNNINKPDNHFIEIIQKGATGVMPSL